MTRDGRPDHPPPRRARPSGAPGRRGAALAVAVALVLAACGGTGGSERAGPDRAADPTTSSDTIGADAPPAGGGAEVAPIPWRDCGGAECATVAVPLDHDVPDGPTIDLAVLRRPATGDRIGSLFFNFGGPGSGTVSILRGFPVPAEVSSRFDLVAVDPRGVGGSAPLSCGVDPTELYGVDPTVEDEGDAVALEEVSRRYAEDCAARRGDLLPHVGTRDVARDLDLVRAAMGDDQLSFVGYSYGTSIGQAYLDLFPDRARAVILDGVVDPAQTGLELAVEQAEGFETALSRWAAACPSRASCGFADPIAAVESMLAAAEGGVPSSGGLRTLGPGEAAVGLALPLYSSALWPSLDEAVAAALDGDGSGMVGLADRYVSLVDFSSYFAVSCLDQAWPDDVATMLAAADAAAEVAPRFGEAIVTDYLRCAVWPVPPDPLGAITAPGSGPTLVVSTTGDPATPYGNGVDVAERLDGAALLTVEGDGHTIVFQGSGCVDAVAVDLLVDLALPGPGATC